MESTYTSARAYAPGMGEAVADRTINRKIARPVSPHVQIAHLPRRDDIALDDAVAAWCKELGLVSSGYKVSHGDGATVEVDVMITAQMEVEKWADVSYRVAAGNALLEPRLEAPFASGGIILKSGKTLNKVQALEFNRMHHHLRQATMLMSGRHLQHGDENQPNRPGEVFTNCSTAAASFLTFYLLLNGSGVGRCYDDAMQMVDYRRLPIVVCAIDRSHADVLSGEIHATDVANARHLYAGKTIHVFDVPDSREGWAKAVEQLEYMAWCGTFREDVLIINFSGVRHRGSPIAGMQDRPASGPGPLITAIAKVATLRDAGMQPWRAALYADHYLAECVLVGGARRAARMSTKTWRDASVLEFIAVKRGGFLWSSNNSVTVDADFWRYVQLHAAGVTSLPADEVWLANHAREVFEAIVSAAYYDRTGEPGIITVDKLTWRDDGADDLLDGDFAGSARYQLDGDTRHLMSALAHAWQGCRYKVITNPCGEIVLSLLGAYCTIADVVPFHASSDNDAEDAFRTTVRALIRTNLMDFLYAKEVKRTNRIGVGITGLHEYAWTRFGFGWKDLVDEAKSKPFWLMISRFKRAVQDEARSYSALLGVATPHTDTTMKPSGSVSKLFGLTEGAHLPSMREFLRWVQFANGDPLVAQYKAKGYPVRALRVYAGMTIVGFPTRPAICELGMGDKLVTAAEATLAEQYQYLRLLEKYWLTGVESDGASPLSETGNQTSYTAKYDPEQVAYEEFRQTLLDGQSTIRCCSVMPQEDKSAYEYLPEQPVSATLYQAIVAAIAMAGHGGPHADLREDVGAEHVGCASGACPVHFGSNVAHA
jgi:hypothetical protein